MISFLLFVFAAAQAQVTFTPDASSYVEYRAADERGSFTGRAPLASVDLMLDTDNLRAGQLTVIIEPAAFNSGNFIRDTNARRTVFETTEYPEISFVATRLSADANTLRDGTNELSITGDLSMHGVTKSVNFPLTVQLEGETLYASGALDVLLSDYNMSRPSFLNWVVEDRVNITLEVSGTLSP